MQGGQAEPARDIISKPVHSGINNAEVYFIALNAVEFAPKCELNITASETIERQHHYNAIARSVLSGSSAISDSPTISYSKYRRIGGRS